MNSKIAFILLTSVAIALTLYFNLADQPTTSEVKPEIGFKAPDFNLNELYSDETYSLAESNKPVVLNFWASWCPPCREEMPDFVDLYGEYQDDLHVYAINLLPSDNIHSIEQFAKEFEIPFPILLDTDGEVSRSFQVLALPTTFFINADGTIEHKVPGYMSRADLETNFRRLARR